jgi:hypothetical protein
MLISLILALNNIINIPTKKSFKQKNKGPMAQKKKRNGNQKNKD